MGWVRVSDDFYDHPAHAVLGLEEWGLWLWSLAWANRNLTDGAIPMLVVKRMDPDGDATGALIEAGRWDHLDDRVEIHDYLEFQPSAQQIRAKREKERERFQRRSAATPRGERADSAATPPASQPQPQPEDQEIPAADAAVPFSTDFDEWYDGYPRKRERGKALAAYRARRRSCTSHDDLIAARDHYAAAVNGLPIEKIKYPASFLNGHDGPWSEWVDGPPEPMSKLNGYTPGPQVGPQTPTRVLEDGTVEKFYQGAGWMASA
jgi:hypothetical protein